MRPSLKKLIALMPPLDNQRHTGVDWLRVENHLGLAYPCSFKDFVSVYGSSHWFDKLLPFYCSESTSTGLDEFTKAISRKLRFFRGNMYDAAFNPVQVPLYPDKGGLLPFMSDIDGPEYCWLTNSSNPDKCPCTVG